MARLKNEILPIKQFFNGYFESHGYKVTDTLPADLADNLRHLGLYGINVSDKFDGKGWGFSESLFASEPESQVTDVAFSLLGHRCVIDILQECGSHEQKQRFLTKLVNGSLVASEAIYEMESHEDDIFSTKAQHEVEANTWVLNGSKSFVIAPPKPSKLLNCFGYCTNTKGKHTK
ncbi:Acyl-CoA dehydrogenase family member 9, mitochondrial [Eumeta japonica]|uniref:Acyl-CoA dehydrogenase family member 9, mitochondrial n=1 Tax=Eumeta variegata TaxID=151549 RepID=A0A4C1SSG4_EUMVA|nr:Acyl-CoA dehydrogenase family member 9, mitochondrial [Eumeta japonica]